MRRVLEDLLHSTMNNNTNTAFEVFQNGGVSSKAHQNQRLTEMTKKNPMLVIASFILIELVVLLLGKYLWNKVVVNIVTFAKPIRSIWHVLGLSILIKLLTD